MENHVWELRIPVDLFANGCPTKCATSEVTSCRILLMLLVVYSHELNKSSPTWPSPSASPAILGVHSSGCPMPSWPEANHCPFVHESQVWLVFQGICIYLSSPRAELTD